MVSKRRNADLMGFAALLGDSFSSKINLLTQIIQQQHYPSLGRYKERLLSKLIAEYVPKECEVGTGFVLFVHEATKERAKKPGFDDLNMGSHTLSRQCDILVFDSSKIPVVFRDDDFVVVRPESVRAVIEVKGSASTRQIGDTLDSLLDFGQKWRRCQLFYLERHQPLTRAPSLYVMCWDVGRDKRGRPLTNGTRIMTQIAKFYKTNMNLDELKGFPRLDKLFLYNDCEICKMGFVAFPTMVEGYSLQHGQFLRHDAAGAAYRSGDRTVASLLADLHHSVCSDFNRFYSYTDESRDDDSAAEEEQTYAIWLTDEHYIRDSNIDYVVDKEK